MNKEMILAVLRDRIRQKNKQIDEIEDFSDTCIEDENWYQGNIACCERLINEIEGGLFDD